jgi:hypothetical protein
LLRLDLHDRPDAPDTGAVDENVESSEPGSGLRHGRVDARAVRNVQRHATGLTPGSQTIGDPLRSRLIDVDHDDRGAFGEQAADHGLSYSAAASGNHRSAIDEPLHDKVSSIRPGQNGKALQTRSARTGRLAAKRGSSI